MNPFSGAVVFIIIWWCVFFTVLPWGVETPDEPEPGHATSAPLRPRLGLKAAVTTGIAVVLWGIAFWVIESDLVSFRG